MEKYCANDGNIEITWRTSASRVHNIPSESGLFAIQLMEFGIRKVSWFDLNAVFESKFNASTRWTFPCMIGQRCARKRISSDGLQQGSARPSANNFPKISQRLHQRLFQTRPGDNKNIAQESQECNPSCSDLNRLPDRGCYRKVSSAPTGLQDSQDSIRRSACVDSRRQ